MKELLECIKNNENTLDKCLNLLNSIEENIMINNKDISYYNKNESMKIMFYLYAIQNSNNFNNFINEFLKFYESNFIEDNYINDLHIDLYKEINDKLEKQFGLISKLFSNKEYRILVTNCKNKSNYGGSTCIIGEESFLTLLYKIEEDYSMVYLHELGHIFAYYLTKSLSTVPDDFKSKIKVNNDNYYIEIFTDIFAVCVAKLIGITYDSKYFNMIKNKIDIDDFCDYFIKKISD